MGSNPFVLTMYYPTGEQKNHGSHLPPCLSHIIIIHLIDKTYIYVFTRVSRMNETNVKDWTTLITTPEFQRLIKF